MKSFKKAAVPAVVALAFTGQLYAQPADPVEPPPTETTEAPVPNLKISADEMARTGVELETQVRVDTQHVQHLQTVARNEKDVIKLSCVNDKYIKLKAEANLFDMAHRELEVSLASDGRFTAYTSVTTAGDRVRKLREEADRCAGEADLMSEDSSNTFTQPEIVDDPTTGLPFDNNGTLIEPPGYASPFS